MTTPEVLILRRTFAAAREHVYRAWTEAQAFQRWFNPMHMRLESVTLDARVGGEFRLRLVTPEGEITHVIGKFIEVKRPEKLVFTWESVATDHRETRVTVEFHERGDQTEVILTHEGLMGELMVNNHRGGWGSCLENLSEVL